MKRYQGEPVDKLGIQQRFHELLERSSDASNDEELASIKAVLRHILRSV